MKAKILLSVFALGATLCIAQPAVNAATYNIKSETDAWKQLEHSPSMAEQPEEVTRYYGGGSSNTLNFSAPIEYCSQIFAGYGSGHTMNITGGGKDDKLDFMAGSTSNNTLNMSAGKAFCVYGAWNDGTESANGNKVSFSGGAVSGVYGGYAGDNGTGSADGNTVEISGGTISGEGVNDVRVGYSVKGGASNNALTVSGGTFSAALLFGGSGDTRADGNTVKISSFSGSIHQIYGGHAIGSMGYTNTVTASNNIVTLDNKADGVCIDSYYIVGGYAQADKSAVASDNKVQILGGTYKKGTIHGGGAYVSQNGSSATASNNTVEISGGKLIGSESYTYSYIYGGVSNGGKVEGNQVIIRGGTIDGFVYAGNAGEKGTELNNSIDIYKGTNLDLTKAELYGTQYKTDAASLKKANPVLNVHASSSSIKVKKISSFAKINYNLPNTVKNGDTILEAETANLAGTEISLSTPGGTNLKDGDTINLLSTKTGIEGEPEQTIATFAEGVSIERDMDIKVEDNALVGTLLSGPFGGEGSGVKLKEDTKSLVETRSAAMAVLNNSIDMVTDKGFAAARDAARAETDKGFAPFIYAGGNSMRYQTGSHVDSHGWGLAAGFAKEIKGENHTLLTGPFVEYGRSNYDSYLDNGTKADGKNRFTGGGWFVRNELKNGINYEASIRFGHLSSDYKGYGAMDTEYDAGSNYVGFHAGVGKTLQVGKKDDSLDVYAKYFYTHQNGTEATLSTGEQYHFDGVDSNRTRLGVRYTHPLKKNTSLYAGLAWDYEFSSEARATYKGLSTPSPSMKGSSGMLELGVKCQLDSNYPFYMDISLAGWAGKQRGLAFNAAFQWTF